LDVRKTAKAKALAAFLGSLPEGLPLEYVSARGSFASESVSEQFGQLSRFTTLRRVTIEFMSELLADTSKLFRIFGGAGVEEAAIWGSGFSLLPRPALDEVTGSFAHLRVLVFKFGLADNELNRMLYRLGAARQLERLVLYMGFWRKSAVDPDAFRQLSTLPSLRWLELECGSAQDNRDIWVPPLGLLCECPALTALTLSLRRCNLKARHLQGIIKVAAVPNLAGLELDLKSNLLMDKHVKQLCEAFVPGPELRFLKLEVGGVGFTTSKASKAALRGLKRRLKASNVKSNLTHHYHAR